MSKVEMINRMIVLGCMNEEDRKYWEKESEDYITEIYIEIVSIRMKYLKSTVDKIYYI